MATRPKDAADPEQDTVAEKWADLTWKLPPEAKAGDREAIGTWVSHWGEARNIEAAVWIEKDANGETLEVGAGTTSLPDAVKFPKKLLTRFNDASASIELWHNHPSLGGRGGIAAAGPEDIGMALCEDIDSVMTVDDGAKGKEKPRWTKIEGLARGSVSPAAAMMWALAAQGMAKLMLPEPDNEEAKHYRDIEIAKATIAAAETAGLISCTGLRDDGGTLLGPAVARETNVVLATPQALTERLSQGESSEVWLSTNVTTNSRNAQEQKQWDTQTHRRGI